MDCEQALNKPKIQQWKNEALEHGRTGSTLKWGKHSPVLETCKRKFLENYQYNY